MQRYVCRGLFHGLEARIEVSRLFFPFWIPCFPSYNIIFFLFSACLCSLLVSGADKNVTDIGEHYRCRTHPQPSPSPSTTVLRF
ncbi:hypothetical protein EMPG_11173 [Blastomyces silverae]|uniref:Uncharacterized protein n=1 Tax=Blastomyces silverae TaxID=2060906 RepID=A0A0H1B1X7_9EURO|nr:hypothetical protein EMPG_11173 [Blastomyces silverae]